MRRPALVLAFVLLALAVLAGAGLAWLATRDLAAIAAHRASAALGREVRIARLALHPGRWIGIDAAGLTLANLPGAPDPDMLRIGRLHAELDALSLLAGPPRLRNLRAEDSRLVLEKVAGLWNWNFAQGQSHTQAVTVPPRAEAATVSGFDIAYRLGRRTLRTHLAEARIAAEGETTGIAATGSFNDLPLKLEATLGAANPFRARPEPVPARLRLASGTARLGFDGTLADPLNVDGAAGRLTLAAPDVAALLAAAGLAGLPHLPLDLAGTFARQGDHWSLADAEGSLAGTPFTARALRLDEGSRAAPDAVTIAATTGKLDLSAWPGGPAGAGAAIPLTPDPNPDPLISADLAAPEVTAGGIDVRDAKLAIAHLPGRIELRTLAATWLGAGIRADGRVEAAPAGGRLTLNGTASNADLATLARRLGFGVLPLSGRLAAQARLTAEGATADAAARTARVQAVATLRDGRIEQRLVRRASLDLRLLLHAAPGTVPVSCLLAVADRTPDTLRLAPFRLATPAGSIAGRGTLDLRRATLDLVFGSESATTSFWALDVALRVTGTFANPRIVPAALSGRGRAALTRLDALPPLPGALAGAVRASRCAR